MKGAPRARGFGLDTLDTLAMPKGTLVVYQNYRDAVLGRVVERHLDPNRKPGVGRVSYDVEPGLLRADGSLVFGVFEQKRIPASKLSRVEDAPENVRTVSASAEETSGVRS